MDENDLFMVHWTDRLDQVRRVRPDSKWVDERFELVLQSFILDSEETRIDSTEEDENARA